MKKKILAILAMLALAFGGAAVVAPTASADNFRATVTPMVESLNLYGPGGSHAEVRLTYDLSHFSVSEWAVIGLGGTLQTSPDFRMNALWVDLDDGIGSVNWTALWHYGGTAATLDDVSSSWTFPTKTGIVVEADHPPMFRANGWGVCVGSGNDFDSDTGSVLY